MDDQNLSLDQILDLNLVKKTFIEAGVDPTKVEQNLPEITNMILANLFIMVYGQLSDDHKTQIGTPDTSTPEKSQDFIMRTLQLIDKDETIVFDPQPLLEQSITKTVNYYQQQW